MLWPWMMTFLSFVFMLYLLSLWNPGWEITGLISDAARKTIARMNECQGTELEVHFLVGKFSTHLLFMYFHHFSGF